MFSDEDGTQEISAPQKIDSLGHDWGTEIEYEWSEDNASVTASRVCTRNDAHVDSETAEATSEVTQPATCTDPGKTKYTAVFKNEAFSSAEKEVDDPEAFGHDWGEWEVTKAASETEEGIEMRTCKNDASHTETQSVPKKAHEHKLTEVEAREATCTEDGNITYWVCDQGENPCGKYFSDAAGSSEINKADITVAAIGHDWGEWTVTKKATKTEEGSEMRTCKNDASHTETRTIQKLDPKEVTYSCTEGSGAKWTKGSKKDASFTFKRSKNDSETFSHFTGIQVDGKDVAFSNYTAKAGSVIVKLKPSYMETLTAGKHTLTARFDDGNDVSAEFTVLAAGADSKNNSSTDIASKNSSTSPATGDDSSMALWVCLLSVSLFAMGGIMITRRRKGNR